MIEIKSGMEHFYHLIETAEYINIGDVEVTKEIAISFGAENSVSYEDTQELFTVDKPMSFKGVLMLFTSEGKPVFEPNAYILSRRIVEGAKDVKPTCFHLLRYYRYLDANNLKWDDHEERLQRYPIFLYRAYLEGEIEKVT
ncbi:hypothetical protein ACMAZD_21500 [Vibrio sp. nBUS_14]|uniref:hypothetical protein n=1 Tax=Vibrio sp. nBUS_14 TaxID=3395321 RepID=UPI003EBD893C